MQVWYSIGMGGEMSTEMGCHPTFVQGYWHSCRPECWLHDADRFLVVANKAKLKYWSSTHLLFVGMTLIVNRVLMPSFGTSLQFGMVRRKFWGSSRYVAELSMVRVRVHYKRMGVLGYGCVMLKKVGGLSLPPPEDAMHVRRSFKYFYLPSQLRKSCWGIVLSNSTFLSLFVGSFFLSFFMIVIKAYSLSKAGQKFAIILLMRGRWWHTQRFFLSPFCLKDILQLNLWG